MGHTRDVFLTDIVIIVFYLSEFVVFIVCPESNFRPSGPIIDESKRLHFSVNLTSHFCNFCVDFFVELAVV